MLVRRKGPGDEPGCAALMTLTHRLDGYPRYLPEDLDGFVTSPAELAAWVVEADGEILAHVALHAADGDPTLVAAQQATQEPTERLAVLARLMVHPRIRRGGVAQRLVRTATGHAAEVGRRTVLDVLQESGEAIALYEAMGWRRLGPVELPIPGHPHLQLWVYLSPP